jgi:hypothetical protein
MKGKDLIESVKKDKSLDVYQKSALFYEVADKSLDELFKEDDSAKNLDQVTKEIKLTKNITGKGFMLYHKKIDDVFKSKKYFERYSKFEDYITNELWLSYSSYLEQRSVYYAMLEYPDLRLIVSQFEYSKVIPAIPLLNNSEIPEPDKKQIVKDIIGSMSEKTLKQMKEWAREQKEKWNKTYDEIVKQKKETIAQLSVIVSGDKTPVQIAAEQMLFGENAVRMANKKPEIIEYAIALTHALEHFAWPEIGVVAPLETQEQKNELYEKIQHLEIIVDGYKAKVDSLKKFID